MSNYTSNRLYPQGPTDPAVYNPANVVVTTDDAYMIIEKNTPYAYLDIIANNVTNASLDIRGLQRHCIFPFLHQTEMLSWEPQAQLEPSVCHIAHLDFNAVGELTLNLFHGSSVLRTLTGLNLNDSVNNAIVNTNLATICNVVYTPERYIEFLILLGGNVTNTVLSTGDATTAISPDGKCADTGFSLPYLSGNHETTQYIRVPVVRWIFASLHGNQRDTNSYGVL